MATHIVDNLWRLEIPLEGNPLKNLNSYLIKGEPGEQSLLIDTGFHWESCRVAMERELAAVGVDPDHMDIFLTHQHSDHCGLAPDLIRPGNKVYISSTDEPGIAAAINPEQWTEWYNVFLLEGFSQDEVTRMWGMVPSQEGAPKSWVQVHTVEHGDTLTYGGHIFECMLTPGHTPGHMCLYEAEQQWLFSGDHVLFHISPNICRWPDVEDSLGDYLDSLTRIRTLPVKLLLPAHREETGVLQDRVDELLAHHVRRIDNTWDVVEETPGMTSYEIAGKMRWKIRSRNWEEFPLAQKFFAVGETLAHLDFLERRGRVERRFEHGQYTYYIIPVEG